MSSGVVYLPSGVANFVVVDTIISGQYAPALDTTAGVLRIDGQSDIPLSYPPNGGSSFTIEIPAVTVPSGQVRQARLLLNVHTALGHKQIRKVYRFVDVFDIPTDRDAVRSLLGVHDYEIGDHHIPLDQVYLNSYNNDFSAAFHLARISDNFLNEQFGQYLALKTSLATLPSLMVLLSKKQVSENGEFSRLGSAADLEKLAAGLQDQLSELMEDFGDYLIDTGFGTVNGLRFIAITPDEITGI